MRETLSNVLWKSRLVMSTAKEARLLGYDLCLVNSQEVLDTVHGFQVLCNISLSSSVLNGPVSLIAHGNRLEMQILGSNS